MNGIFFFFIFSVIAFIVKGAIKEPKHPDVSEEKKIFSFDDLVNNMQDAPPSPKLDDAKQQSRTVFTADGKPYIPHSGKDCTGGSIHDGYHEGTPKPPTPASSKEGRRYVNSNIQRIPNNRPSPLPGQRGKINRQPSPTISATNTIGMNDQQVEPMKHIDKVESSEANVTLPTVADETGVDRLVKKINKEPSIIQGIIWSEILGKPKGERY